MTADLGPLDVEPRAVRPPFDQPHPARSTAAGRATAIREALAGVELGAYDERIIAWLSTWDVGTVGGVVSLLGRVRQAGGGSCHDTP